MQILSFENAPNWKFQSSKWARQGPVNAGMRLVAVVWLESRAHNVIRISPR